MRDPTPSSIIAGKYELLREVARGGMGAVWVALDHALHREVAIKLILAEGADHAATRERFTREARSLASLASRHIVSVFDFGIEGESPFLVMELLHGEDLGSRLKERTRLSVAEVDVLAQQIGKALGVAHERGLVHRDLKPGNVFLARADGEEIVKVLDFGIAKVLDAPSSGDDLTRTGAVVGTPQYMSPEQFRAAKRVDHRSDLWSLGAVLYRCLTGQPAFSGDSIGELIMAIAGDPPPVPSQVSADLSPAVDAFFARVFQRDPAARFQSARELAEAFAEVARGGPASLATAVVRADASAPPDAATVHVGPSRPPTGSGRARETTPLSLPERPSIAVLPFQNISGDPEQDYFADGMVEELVTALSRLGGLFVIARQSTFIYKGRTVDVRQVARELGVRYALEGSVRKAGPRVRITAQLVDAESGKHLWADRYDGALADVFDLQDRITESVVGAIQPSVQAAEIERARRKHPESLDAYDLLLRALPHCEGHSVEEVGRALPLLEQALALDPSYALAHAYAAWCIEQRFVRGGGDPADRAASLRHAREALAAGRGDPTALALGGFVVGMLDGDAPGALTALDEAIALNPSSALAYGFSAVLRVFRGDFERGVAHAERAIRLSPLDPARAYAWIAIAYAHFFREGYAESAAAAEKSAHANPRFPVAQVLLVGSRARLGRPAEASAAVTRLLEIEPDFRASAHDRVLASIGVRAAWRESLAAALREAGVPS